MSLYYVIISKFFVLAIVIIQQFKLFKKSFANYDQLQKDRQIILGVLKVDRQTLRVDRQVLSMDRRMDRQVLQVKKQVLAQVNKYYKYNGWSRKYYE